MSEEKIPPITLLGKLLVGFCIPAISGKVSGESPVAGTEISAEMRKTLGITTEGRTIGYPARDATVFLDLNKERAQVWFIHPDAHEALGPVQSTLAAAIPGLTLIHEARPMRGLGELIGVGDLGGGRGVRVEISHPAGGRENFFVVRIIGLKITDPASFKKQLETGKP